MIIENSINFFFETFIFYIQLISCPYGRTGYIIVLEPKDISFIKEKHLLDSDDEMLFLIEYWLKQNFDINWRRVNLLNRGKFTWLLQSLDDALLFREKWV